MKNRNIAHYLLALALLVAFGASSCSDWTEEEPVKQDIVKPGDQDPEKYAQYLETLRSYKKSDHYLVFARMNNAPEISVSERDFLRSMPDSLDVVSLRYGDRITDYDVEDIPLVQKKGTRILYGFDPSERKEADFSLYLNGLIDRVRTLGLNGISVVLSTPLSAQDEQTLVSSLSAVAGPGKSLLLVFEGNPEAISETNRSKFDYFVLPTSTMPNVLEVRNSILYAHEVCGIGMDKIILSVIPNGNLFDSNNKLQKAIPEMARCVVALGPVGGLDVYDIHVDYALNTEHKYMQVRSAIDLLNPSPLK